MMHADTAKEVQKYLFTVDALKQAARHYHEAARDAMHKKDLSSTAMKEAWDRLSEAQKSFKEAKNAYKQAREKFESVNQQYGSALARLSGYQRRLQRRREQEALANASLKKYRDIQSAEIDEVEKAKEHAVGRVSSAMKGLEEKKAEAQRAVDDAEREYGQWQEGEDQLAKTAAKLEADINQAIAERTAAKRDYYTAKYAIQTQLLKQKLMGDRDESDWAWPEGAEDEADMGYEPA
ncbi:unnamed protein product [Vitrella brassicaformis CCMP3155]|uniref:Uncharacterized protein n=1 Tax=Vitrella brassicaformis (strain CCMP3155) TaxID=1169540 RepID=A0A0G4EKM7_VITBC|nr:unnamed protein product [Vitrella brassicaformis CCMP3155]|eukprot:CEL96979.1 unnamed protein product [Vitrella brassicaformis CCMP3155]